MSVVYDAGVLVAAARNGRRVWADHRIRLELGAVPTTTAPVVAQVSRSARLVPLRRFLRGCAVVPFSADQSHDVGDLLGKARRADVVDAHLVVTAAALGSTVITADVGDLRKLSMNLTHPVPVRAI
jgi:predicted nucleic acid-binding protein